MVTLTCVRHGSCGVVYQRCWAGWGVGSRGVSGVLAVMTVRYDGAWALLSMGLVGVAETKGVCWVGTQEMCMYVAGYSFINFH